MYCGLDGADGFRWDLLTNDHLVPSARDEKYEEANLVTACLGCNTLKAGYEPRENGEPLTPEEKQRLIDHATREIERRRRTGKS